MDFANLLIQLLNSVQYGLLLFMLAAGLTLIFGIMGVVNLAHGSFYMLGAYLAWYFTSALGSLTLAIVLGTVLAVVFWTPRITMHRWLDSMTTATPCGLSTSMMALATSRVSRSCTCSRRANISAMRGSFEMPMTLLLGM